MEAYLSLCLFSLLNISEVSWETGLSGIEASNVLSYMTFITTIIGPIALFVYFYRNRDRWEDEDFQERAGQFLEGVRHDKDHKVTFMVHQTTFFVRRFILCVTLVYWQKVVWGQLFFQFVFSVGMMILMQLCKPLEGGFENNMATLNEVTILMILYMLMYFSDFLDDPTWRQDFGVTYILILCAYSAIHLFFIYWQSGRSLFIRARYAWNWRRQIWWKLKARFNACTEKIREKFRCCNKVEVGKGDLDVIEEESEYDSEEEEEEDESQGQKLIP